MASARRTIMAAFDPATLERWRALAIVDRDGTTVGTINEFYLDRGTGDPTWALVETGLFGTTQTFVPLVHATEIADGLQVPYEKRHIRNSPRVDLHDELTPDEEARLFAHYGVDYQPFADRGPGPVPVDAVPEEPGTTEGPDPTPAAPETLEGPEPVPEEPGTTENPEPAEDPETAAGASGTAEEPETAEGTDADPGSPGTAEDSAPAVDEPGSAEAPPSAPAESGEPALVGSDEPAPAEGGERAPMGSEEPTSVESREPAPMGSEEPTSVGSEEPPAPTASEEESGTVSEEPGTAEGPGLASPEPGTAGPDDATLITPGGYGGTPDHPDDPPDPDLSRTVPVEPDLPGSTAASLGPVPTTVDKDGDDPDRPRTEEPSRDQDEPQWAPAPAGSFDEPDSSDRRADSSDRWREAKLAAERDRIARAAAAQPEERSPLERARRRLERLVGVGQDHSDDDISPSDREEAERARRARLGFDEDDPRFR
jgi:hypothetical protein